jgi:hypothetical protein
MERTSLQTVPAFRVADLAPRENRDPWHLLGRGEAQQVADAIVERLRGLPPGSLLRVDLSGVESRASALAVLLGEPLRLVQSLEGEPELPGRYLVVDESLGSNAQDAHLGLADEKLVVVMRQPTLPRLLGKVDRVVEDTYRFLTQQRSITSSLLTEPPMELKLSAANARVTKLHRLGLLHQVGEETVDSGGRRFVYEAVR